MRLKKINTIYKNCAGLEVVHCNIRFDQMKQFMLSFRNLEEKISMLEDDYWRRFLTFFRRYRFEVATTLLPFGHPGILNHYMYETIKEQLSKCKLAYPQYSQLLSKIFSDLDELISEGVCTLLEILYQVLNSGDGKKTLLLVRESRFCDYLNEFVKVNSDLSDLSVTNTTYLDEFETKDQIVVIGASKWYPEFIFTSPAARRIILLNFDWINDHLPVAEIFSELGTGNNKVVTYKETFIDISIGKSESEKIKSNEFKLDAVELIPKIEWANISNKFSADDHEKRDDIQIDAYLCLLTNGGAVFLNGSPDATVLAIDFSEKQQANENNLNIADTSEAFVKRTKIDQLSSEMFVLLRTQGGGDYIVSLANKILGDKSMETMQLHSKWKSKLRQKVNEVGCFKVSVDLLDQGSDIAEEQNVRNWMSEESIRPRKDSEFMAILKYLGLESDSHKYFYAAKLIDRAHRMAGFHIRKLLLQEVKKLTTEQFIKLNEMAIEIPDVEAGSITAYKIMEKSPYKMRVPLDQLNHVITKENPLWHE